MTPCTCSLACIPQGLVDEQVCRLSVSLVLCLCCGEWYDADGDCENVDDGAHSIARALAVAQLLSLFDVEHPTPQHVLDALDAISA